MVGILEYLQMAGLAPWPWISVGAGRLMLAGGGGTFVVTRPPGGTSRRASGATRLVSMDVQWEELGDCVRA